MKIVVPLFYIFIKTNADFGDDQNTAKSLISKQTILKPQVPLNTQRIYFTLNEYAISYKIAYKKVGAKHYEK